MKNIFLKFRNRIGNHLTTLKKTVTNKVSNVKETFDENYKAVQKEPRSKRKAFLLGVVTPLSLFGITLFVPFLAAFAKDAPDPTPGSAPSGAVCGKSGKSSLTGSADIINGLMTAAATVCGLAVSSGSFAVGAACGVIVVVGILIAQGK